VTVGDRVTLRAPEKWRAQGRFTARTTFVVELVDRMTTPIAVINQLPGGSRLAVPLDELVLASPTRKGA
jgi:hypothetical protein